MRNSKEFRPRRSCLYMPGANARALEKAKSLPADVLILDLEDAVAPEAKAEAREALAAVVAQQAYGYREVFIRSNALDTEWGEADLEMAVMAGSDGVLVPKVSCAGDIIALNTMLSDFGAPESLSLWVMIELPLAVLNLQQIAATATSTRLQGIVLGLNDLAKETRAIATPDRQAFHFALSQAVLAARAYGLTAIDAVYNDFKNDAGFALECHQSRILGFDGKSLIHPQQIATANEVFSPSKDELEQANAIVAAFSLPENQHKGVIKVEGAMVELLHLEQARHTVAIQAAIDQSAAAQGS